MQKLLSMLEYARPEGSVAQDMFNGHFLFPVFGPADKHGNYIKTIGDKPRLAFMAHHDTVHTTSCIQQVNVTDGFIWSNSNCLGADCTTGVWLILEMIKAGIEGTYVVHAGEEIGCLGSRALVADDPEWLYHTDAAISFDRKGYKSVITYQMGVRTASDAFAESFADAVGMDFEADDGGSYTDSNEYANVIPECTNISVGYFAQHTDKERQDATFALTLRDALITADWSKIVAVRDPEVYDTLYTPKSSTFVSRFDRPVDGQDEWNEWLWKQNDAQNDADTYYSNYDDVPDVNSTEQGKIENLLVEYSPEMAEVLIQYGFTANQLMDDMEMGVEGMMSA